MNLVDSCGWIEYAANGPNADFFAPAIEKPLKLVVPTICILEVFKKALREGGEPQALALTTHMRRGRVIELDSTIAVWAARISLEHKLPLADSVVLATARANRAVVWTQDAHFADLDGVKYIKRKG